MLGAKSSSVKTLGLMGQAPLFFHACNTVRSLKASRRTSIYCSVSTDFSRYVTRYLYCSRDTSFMTSRYPLHPENLFVHATFRSQNHLSFGCMGSNTLYLGPSCTSIKKLNK